MNEQNLRPYAAAPLETASKPYEEFISASDIMIASEKMDNLEEIKSDNNNPKRVSVKKRRHQKNSVEKARRNRESKSIQTLKGLIPNCSKMEKLPLLDCTIKYMASLQHELKGYEGQQLYGFGGQQALPMPMPIYGFGGQRPLPMPLIYEFGRQQPPLPMPYCYPNPYYQPNLGYSQMQQTTFNPSSNDTMIHGKDIIIPHTEIVPDFDPMIQAIPVASDHFDELFPMIQGLTPRIRPAQNQIVTHPGPGEEDHGQNTCWSKEVHYGGPSEW